MRDMLDSCSALRTRQLPVVLRNPGGHRTKHNGLKDIMKFYTLWILMTLFSQIWDDLSYHYYTIIIPLLYHYYTIIDHYYTIIIPLLYHYYTIIILYEPLIFTIQAPLQSGEPQTHTCQLAPRWWTLSPRHLLRVLRLRVRLPGHPMAQASNWQMRWAIMIQTLSIYLSAYLSIYRSIWICICICRYV